MKISYNKYADGTVFYTTCFQIRLLKLQQNETPA